jgi:hypothetical protein
MAGVDMKGDVTEQVTAKSWKECKSGQSPDVNVTSC